MNVLLLCLVLPLGFALLVYDARVAYVLYHMTEDERRVAWGDLHGTLFRVAAVTYVLSGFGCVSSFVLFASQENADSVALFAFPALNVSCLVFDYALLREMRTVVLACVWTNIFVYAVLFVQTVVVFSADAGAASAGLLLATHACNVVAILHGYVIDLLIWYSSWTDAQAEYHGLRAEQERSRFV
jgi:hypothetical protein